MEKGYFCDCTFGGGGHTFALLERAPQLKVIAFDQDFDAVKNGLKNIEKRNIENNVRLIHSNFSHLGEKIDELGLREKIDGLLFDLGVSSHHLEDASRGFSFQKDGPLDMRMNQSDTSLPTAQEILEQKSEKEIADIIYLYGEERYSRSIASAICTYRSQKTLKSTKQLENIVFHCYPKRERYRKTHPATRTFQALRLYVNRELEVLEQVLLDAIQVLNKGGQLAVISFHSLEDRIVKHRFKNFAKEGYGIVMTRKPILPTAKELEENKRSRSAKLRVFKKE